MSKLEIVNNLQESDRKITENAVYNVWNKCPAIKVPNTSFTIKGWSVAAHRTNFYIPELKIMLDAGISSPYSPDHIFITHCHGDHTANLPFHLLSPKENQRIQVYIPGSQNSYFADYVKSSFALNGAQPFDDSKRSFEFVSVKAGERVNATFSGKRFVVDIIGCDHTVDCVGYGFSEKRLKLRNEFASLKGAEIAAHRKNGIDVMEETEISLLLFLGDTSCKVLKDPFLDKYPTIMIECTFLLDEHLDQANKTLHMHWSQLEQYVADHPKILFILYHFSQRYKKAEITHFFAEKKFSNVYPWTEA